MKTISLVVPVFNEEDSIAPFLARVSKVVAVLSCPVEYVFVNDGSTDGSLQVIQGLLSSYNIVCVNLSRNFGKEAALTAGIAHASGDAVVPIDVDLQDPPELLLAMTREWEGGADVVLARRADRSSDGWLKRKSAEWFYAVQNRLSDTSIPANVGDFRLMDRRVVDAVLSLGERRRFMKGVFSWVGFRSVFVDYTREERAFGNSKFNGWKLWNLAVEGITSFSTVPLRVWSYCGALISTCAFCHAAYLFFRTVMFGVDVPGYASIMVAILFLGGRATHRNRRARGVYWPDLFRKQGTSLIPRRGSVSQPSTRMIFRRISYADGVIRLECVSGSRHISRVDGRPAAAVRLLRWCAGTARIRCSGTADTGRR